LRKIPNNEKEDTVDNKESKKVHPYEDEMKEKEEIVLRTYEYHHPFNYPNVQVNRKYPHGEQHGMELFPVTEIDGYKPADSITINEEDPIVRVVVIGSACTPPGYVQLEAEPIESFRREKEDPNAMPVRFRQNNLWGQHMRVDQLKGGKTYHEFPLTGMSCAIFEIPKSKKEIITGGSENHGWTDDNYPDDDHYSFRIIRVTVAESGK